MAEHPAMLEIMRWRHRRNQASALMAVALLFAGTCAVRDVPARAKAFRSTAVAGSDLRPGPLSWCAPGDLRLSYSTRSYKDGDTLAISISTMRRSCQLHGIWPQIDLHGSSDRSRFAKAYPYLSALFRTQRKLASELKPDGATNFAVKPASNREIDLVSTGNGKCFRLRGLTYYLTQYGGPASDLALRAPIRLCGSIFVLPFIPGETPQNDPVMSRDAATLAANIQSSHDQSAQQSVPFNDSDGFHYGTDTGAPTLCHSIDYWVPVAGDCANGYLGRAGMYAGAVGGWQNNYGCGSVAQWLTVDANDVNTNLTTYGVGFGAAGYYHAGGAQRDYYYDGTSSEANSWGQNQASNAENLASKYPIYSGFLMVDIEVLNGGYTDDGNGWNSGGFPTSCSTSPTNNVTHTDLNNQVVKGFHNWLKANTSYWTAFYSSGGSASSGPNTWRNIMGSNDITATSEWTFSQQHGDGSTGPNGWTLGSYSAQWFGNAPTDCDFMWQWTAGGNNGDYDQIDNSVALAPCG